MNQLHKVIELKIATTIAISIIKKFICKYLMSLWRFMLLFNLT
ncbi:hypothetical protein [Desulfuribacillus stibiiarsenatis]|nr:hypothetical protein [Desulfuribacillus stibiiarsenatis]